MSPTWQLDVRGKFTSKPTQGTVPSSATRALHGPLGRRIAGAFAARAPLLSLQPPAIKCTRSEDYGVRDGRRFLAAGTRERPLLDLLEKGRLGGGGDELVAWMQET